MDNNFRYINVDDVGSDPNSNYMDYTKVEEGYNMSCTSNEATGHTSFEVAAEKRSPVLGNDYDALLFTANPYNNVIQIGLATSINSSFESCHEFATLENIRVSDFDLNELIEIKQKVSKKTSVHIKFRGLDSDYEHLQHLAEEYNKIPNNAMVLAHVKIDSTIDRVKIAKEIRKAMAESKIENLNNEKLLTALDDAINEKNQLVVCATMSAGKSSLINSMLSKKLMPAKNTACTAKIMRLMADNKLANFVDLKGNLVTQESLSVINDAESEEKVVYLKGPIENFKNIPNFEIIDTPGPNNSLNQDHKTVTYDFIKSDIKPVTIVLLDGTKFLTTDEADFLSIIAQENKNKGKINQDRFIFAINKSDEFNPDDSLEQVKKDAKDMLNKYGISNPKIHFISARNSLLARMSQKNEPLRADEQIGLLTAKLMAEQDLYKFYMESDLSASVRNKVMKEIEDAIAKQDWNRVIIAKSGVLGLELSIEEFMVNHKEVRMVNKVIKLCSRALENDEMIEKMKKEIDSNLEKSEAMIKDISRLKKEVGDPRKMKELANEISNVRFADTLMPIEKTINKEFDGFRRNILSLKVSHVNGVDLVDTQAAMSYVTSLQNKYSHLRANLLSEFTASINRDVVQTLEKTMEKYKNHLSKIFRDINVSNDGNYKKYFSNIGEDYIELVKNAKVKEMVTETYQVRNPKRSGLRTIFFWRKKYITKTSVSTVEGIDLNTIKQVLTDSRSDLHGLYELIQKERVLAEKRCKDMLLEQVNKATKQVLAEINKITKMASERKELLKKTSQEEERLEQRLKITGEIYERLVNLRKIS